MLYMFYNSAEVQILRWLENYNCYVRKYGASVINLEAGETNAFQITQWAWRGWWVDMLWPSLTHGSNFLSDQEKNNSSFRQICFPRENTFFGYQFVWHSIQLPKTDLIRTQNFQKVCIKHPGPHLASTPLTPSLDWAEPRRKNTLLGINPNFVRNRRDLDSWINNNIRWGLFSPRS